MEFKINKRIQELAEEANCNIDGMGYGEGNLEKFAELIVKECAEFVWYKAEKSMSQEVLYVGNDLLKHFGVE